MKQVYTTVDECRGYELQHGDKGGVRIITRFAGKIHVFHTFTGYDKFRDAKKEMETFHTIFDK